MFASAAFVAAAFSSSFCGVWLQLSKAYFFTFSPAFGSSLVRPSCSVASDSLGAPRAASSVTILAINDPLSLPYYHFDTGNIPAEPL